MRHLLLAAALGLAPSLAAATPAEDCRSLAQQVQSTTEGVWHYDLDTPAATAACRAAIGADPADDASRAFLARVLEESDQGQLAAPLFAALKDTQDPDAAGIAAWYFFSGAAQDRPLALKLARRSAEGGNAYGTYRLARSLRDEDATYHDAEAAIRWRDRAAEMGLPFAVDLQGDDLMYAAGATDADKARAVEYYRIAAEMGDPAAMADMGRAYRWGIGVEIDHAVALHWWGEGSRRGNGYSSMYLAYMVRNGMGVEADHAEAERLYRLAAEQGWTAAHNGLFNMLWKDGEGERGLVELRRGVEIGESGALDQLARLYRAGELVEKDVDRAIDLFLQADEAGRDGSIWDAFDLVANHRHGRIEEAMGWARDRLDDGGAERLGHIYHFGKGVPKDHLEAARYYEMGHRAGDRYATAQLAMLIASGSVGFRDEAMGVEMLRRAVDMGHTAAMVNLARKLRDGAGVEEDDAASLAMLRDAVEKGEDSAIFDLAYGLANSGDELNDHAEAAVLYEKAAENGSTVAMSNLGEFYEKGLGVAQDEDMALHWYQRAADKDHARAKYKVAMIRIGRGDPADMAPSAQLLAEAADGGWTKAADRLEEAFADDTDPLHAAVTAPTEALAESYLDIGLFFERARVDCGIVLSDCGAVARQRLDLAEAAKWYRRAAVTLPRAQVWLGRLLVAHPQYEALPGEGLAMLDAASDAGLAEARILLSLSGADAVAAGDADTRFAAALNGAPAEEAAQLAALATIGRFGDGAIGPGWRWLEARAAEGEVQAEVGLFLVTLFFGAFDEAAARLDRLPADIALDISEVDYSLRQALRFLMENVRRDVTPSEDQLAAIDRLLAVFEARDADKAEELRAMQAEVRRRLTTRDAYSGFGMRPDLPLADRIAAVEDRIDEKSRQNGLSPHLVPLYQHLAKLQTEAGDPAATERSVYTAMSIAREINDSTRHLTGSLVYHMEMACWLRKGSDMLFEAGRDAAGLTLAKGAVNELQAARSTLVGLPEDLQNCFRDLLSSQYRRMADLLIRQNHLSEAQWVLDQLKDFESYRYANRAQDRAGRSFATLEMSEAQEGVMARIHGLPLTETIRLAHRVEALEDSGDEEAAEALRLQLEEAQDTLADSLDALVEEVEDLDTAGESEIPEEVSARALRRLGGRLDRLDGVAMVYSVTLPERTHFLIVTGQGTEHRTLEMPEAELNARIRALRAALSDPGTDPRPLAQSFYADIWSGVEAGLAEIGARQVLLSLDGLMRYVPVAALHDGDGWLVARRDYVTFTSASRDLLLDDEELEEIEVEALGATRGGGGFSALPYVAREVDAITGGGAGGRAWLDDAFDSGALGTALGSGAPVVHVATHFDLTDNEDSSRMLLGNGEMLSVADLKKGARRGRYDLADVHMLVLSACQTALARGSELESLAAEVQWEGVRTVLATLWPVADRSTAEFMGAFYGALGEGQGRAEALRHVQTAFATGAPEPPPEEDGQDRGGTPLKPVATLRNGSALPGYRHPFYWAGFQLIGQWR